MAKERLFNLPETKGAFQLKGIVTGMKKDNAFREGVGKNSGRPWRSLNFGAEYADDQVFYVTLQGNEQENVFFYKRGDAKNNIPGDVAKVPWAQRFNYNREGYNLIGVNVGVTKKVNEKGEYENENRMLTDFDACGEIRSNLKDGDSVFMRGRVEYSSFIDDKGNKRSTVRIVPNQVSLCDSAIDFDDEEYEIRNVFTQIIIYTGIEQEKDNNGKPTGRFIVSAKIVTYNSIEDAEFIVKDKSLATDMKKGLKPYYAIEVNGHLESTALVEELEDDDHWGEANVMKKVTTPSKKEMVITGAAPKTIERELYSEAAIEEAMAAINRAKNATESFGTTSTENWGTASSIEEDDDEPW